MRVNPANRYFIGVAFQPPTHEIAASAKGYREAELESAFLSITVMVALTGYCPQAALFSAPFGGIFFDVF
jgi:hypothetical protein